MPKIQAPTVAQHRELRRQQLMDAAMELALSSGADSISVASVAAKAGLARSSIYEYFASSADLVADLVIEELDYFTHRLADAIGDQTDPILRIELWMTESLHYVADGRHMLIKSLNTISTPLDRREEIALGHRRMMAPLLDALNKVGVSNVQIAASLLSSIADAATIRIESGNDAELETRSAVTFALAGIRALASNA